MSSLNLPDVRLSGTNSAMAGGRRPDRGRESGDKEKPRAGARGFLHRKVRCGAEAYQVMTVPTEKPLGSCHSPESSYEPLVESPKPLWPPPT